MRHPSCYVVIQYRTGSHSHSHPACMSPTPISPSLVPAPLTATQGSDPSGVPLKFGGQQRQQWGLCRGLREHRRVLLGAHRSLLCRTAVWTPPHRTAAHRVSARQTDPARSAARKGPWRPCSDPSPLGSHGGSFPRALAPPCVLTFSQMENSPTGEESRKDSSCCPS